MDEIELIAGCRRGDRAAQREVYERHADRVYRVALRLTRDEQDAFDVVQETFVRAFERMEGFNERSQLGTWLHRIATNEAFQLFRRRETERRHLRVAGELHDHATRPNAESAQQEIDHALEQLSEEHRAILILRYQEGFTYEELSDVLEITSGTVASRLNRAREALRELLREDRGDSEESANSEHPIRGDLSPELGSQRLKGS
ncbi:MAG: sigma-70 family RNA polymerase sigma factor [Phycisphaerae bacterium]|nr:sigma-70 family RNA polymerase sigma factor [Phycisphaerae bacterium]